MTTILSFIDACDNMDFDRALETGKQLGIRTIRRYRNRLNTYMDDYRINRNSHKTFITRLAITLMVIEHLKLQKELKK